MNRETYRVQVPTIGASSLLVIFAVLCLTIFALLGLSTVHADSRLSDISAEAVSDYYAADYQAERILAQLREGTVPEGVSKTDDIFSYSCPISDTQTLQVEVRCTDWAILRWQAESTVHWQTDDSLLLWDGNS